MMAATTLSGLFMFAVHLLVMLWLEKGGNSYSYFFTLMTILNVSMIPSLGLQTVFAHEAAAVGDEAGRRELAGNIVGILALFAGLWVVVFGLVVLGQEWVLAWLKLEPWGLWVTLCAVLPQFWLPVFCGVLQGKQWFGWLGGAVMFNGLGRFSAVVLVLFLLGPKVPWLMFSALIGLGVAIVLAFMPCRAVLAGGVARIQWRRWCLRALLVALGPGIVQFMCQIDMIVARGKFDEAVSDDYAMARLFGWGLFIFVSPIAGVMFPKLVNQASEGSKAKLVSQTFWATLIIVVLVAGGGVAVCWWAAPAFLQSADAASWLPGVAADWLSKDRTEKLLWVAKLMPCFFGAMGLLALANVFVSHLVARREFGKVGCLLPVPAVYGLGLAVFEFSPVSLILWMGVVSAGLLALVYCFSRRVVAEEAATGCGNAGCERL